MKKSTEISEIRSNQTWLSLVNQLWRKSETNWFGTWTDQIKDKSKSKLEISKRFQNMWRNQLAVCRFSVTNQWVLVHGGPCASWLPSENGKIYGPHLLSGKKYLLINHDWCRWLAERVYLFNTIKYGFAVFSYGFQILFLCVGTFYSCKKFKLALKSSWKDEKVALKNIC